MLTPRSRARRTAVAASCRMAALAVGLGAIASVGDAACHVLQLILANLDIQLVNTNQWSRRDNRRDPLVTSDGR